MGRNALRKVVWDISSEFDNNMRVRLDCSEVGLDETRFSS